MQRARTDPQAWMWFGARIQTFSVLIQDIALIALALAHGADDELHAREVEEIGTQLQSWRREATDPTALAAIKSALETYVRAEGEQLLSAAIARVGAAFSAVDRAALLEDLAAVALADGTITEGERALLDRLGETWGVAGTGASGAGDPKAEDPATEGPKGLTNL